MIRRIGLLAAIAVGMAPGVALPFVIALRLGLTDGDTLLLALSISLFMINVVVAAIESNTIAAVGRLSVSGVGWSFRTLLLYVTGSLVRSLPVILLGTPVMYLLYAPNAQAALELLMATAILAFVPLLGSISAVFAGILITHGRSTTPIATQGLRSLLPLSAILIYGDVHLLVVATLYSLGEFVRLLALSGFSCVMWVRNTVDKRDDAPGAALVPRGLYWQFSSSGLSQSNPVVDRLFLNGTPGDITAYELADKISFSVFQIVYNVMLLARVGSWSMEHGRSAQSAYGMFVRDIRAMFIATSVLAAIGCAVILGALASDLIPAEWEKGLLWGSITLVAMPFAVMVAAYMRYIVIQEKQKYIFAATLAGVGVNAVCDLLLFNLLGSIGIPIASVIARVAVAGLLVFLARRFALQMLRGL